MHKHMAALLLVLITNWALFAQTSTTREYQIKAAFLFNFTQFVEWPSQAFADARSPLVIGVLGEDPFSGMLEQTVRGESVNGHSLVVEHYGKIEELKSCHLLFINLPKSEQLEKALTSLKERSILTVGDASNFARKGGMIRLFAEDNKMRFQVNLEVVKEANLSISSKLLRLADIVPSNNN